MEKRYTTGCLNLQLATAMAGLLVAMTAVSHAQIPPGYELIQITDDPDYDGPPSINNCGQVVFSKRIGNDFNHEEIFLWDNGQLIQITDDDHRDAFPKINDLGTIVWSRTTGGVDTHFEIARWSGGEIEILTDTPSLSEVAGEINNHDCMAWSRYIGGDCARNDLYYFDGENEHQITNDIFSNQSGAINDSDQIAWTQYNFCVTPWWIGNIMHYFGGSSVQLTDDGTQLTNPDIANDGTLVWGGPLNGIEQWKDGIRTVLVPNGRKPEINTWGQIAFICSQNNSSQACLYVDGKVIQLTSLGRENIPSAINDTGDIGINSYSLIPIQFDVLLARITILSVDFDQNGTIDVADFSMWLVHFTGPLGKPLSCESRVFDVDRDQDVDIQDYSAIQLRN